MTLAPGSPFPRLARYAGVVLNALTALAWGGLGLLSLGTGNAMLSIMPFVLVALYTATAWGFIQRSSWALGRSYRVHALGAIIDLYEVIGLHQMIYAPLLVLHLGALVCTHLAKPDFAAR